MKNVFELLLNYYLKKPNDFLFVDSEKEASVKDVFLSSCGIARSLLRKGIDNSPILVFVDRSMKAIIAFFGIAFIPISIINILITSALQVLIPEGLIGKVIAWYSSITALFVPVGSFIGGFVASVIGISNIYALGSLGLLSISLYWICHPKVRKMPNQTGLDSDEYRYMQKNEQII